jgi:hypothetical protein
MLCTFLLESIGFTNDVALILQPPDLSSNKDTTLGGGRHKATGLFSNAIVTKPSMYAQAINTAAQVI